MKVIFIFLLILSISQFSFSQTDDIPDYRSKRESFAKVTEKEIRYDLASFTIGGIDESFAKLPLQSIPILKTDKNFIVLAQDTLNVTITADVFDKSKYKVQYYETKYAVKVNNKAFWGTKSEVPNRIISSITAVIGGDTVLIPPSAYADLFEPNFYYTDNNSSATKSHCAVYISPDKHRVYIYMINGTTDGRYEVTWVIQDKKYLRRVVDYGF